MKIYICGLLNIWFLQSKAIPIIDLICEHKIDFFSAYRKMAAPREICQSFCPHPIKINPPTPLPVKIPPLWVNSQSFCQNWLCLKVRLLWESDFNIHIDVKTDPLNSQFSSLVDSLGFCQSVNVRTHKYNHTSHLWCQCRLLNPLPPKWPCFWPFLNHFLFYLAEFTHQDKTVDQRTQTQTGCSKKKRFNKHKALTRRE